MADGVKAPRAPRRRQSEVDTARHERNVAVAERDRIRRLFNRLEAAVSHHKKAVGYETDDMYEPWDRALYKARDKVLKDYREGNG